jgi:DNA-binding GntR family transcriptional regulator
MSERTRSDAVTERLRRDILEGRLPAGSKLRQVLIAEELGVSTTPVREAFATLAQEGLVVKDPRRGVVVFNPSPEELREIYEIRLALEPLAVELATPRLADIHLDIFEEMIAEMRHTNDPLRRHELNANLHSLIYSHSGRARLSVIIEQLRGTASAYLRFLSSSPPAYRAAVDDEHQEILDALRSRDGAAAAAALRRHLIGSQEHIEQAILRPSQRDTEPQLVGMPGSLKTVGEGPDGNGPDA